MPLLAGLDVGGVSIGGLETCIEVPAYRLAFDVGRCAPSCVRLPTILFTHAHVDHMGGVVAHAATRALWGMPPPTYVVPRTDVEAFDAAFRAWRALDRSELAHERVPFGPGDELALGRELVASAFRSPHRAPCHGYVLWSVRKKLRPELAGLAGEEIARRRAAGVEVTFETRVPELAFSGDTRIEGILEEPAALTARRLVLEATFLDERVSVAKCRAMGHVHLDEIVAHAERFENEAILLTHFSARYRPDDVRRILDERLPAVLRGRVQPLLADELTPPSATPDGAEDGTK